VILSNDPVDLCSINLSVVALTIDRIYELKNISNLSQGHFPQMENIAAFKPVSTSPPRSTCGVPDRSSYCQSPSSQAELLTCFQAFCDQECPYRSSTPPYAPLLLAAHRSLDRNEKPMQNIVKHVNDTVIYLLHIFHTM